MSIDDRAFEGLIEQSQDLHSDAMHLGDARLPDLADAHADQRGVESDPIPDVFAKTDMAAAP